ncbi:MAG: response regulator [Myxococcota bacterium]|nr:response regulator [Myxococcota bacterium]
MPKTLLLADDSVVIQKLVGLSFANEDFDLVLTDNGDDAIARARATQPDIVLADVVMPGQSGYAVCAALKADPLLAEIPVLLLTGTFEAFDESRARQSGAAGHITKPFEAQSLVERVKGLLAAVDSSKQSTDEPATPEAAAGDQTFEKTKTGDDITADALLPASSESLSPPEDHSDFDLGELLDDSLGSLQSAHDTASPPDLSPDEEAFFAEDTLTTSDFESHLLELTEAAIDRSDGQATPQTRTVLSEGDRSIDTAVYSKWGAQQPEDSESAPRNPGLAKPPEEPKTASNDLSPLIQEKIHDTLERVAWEALAELNDTLIRQVVERVEAVAWEVIPQMAEILVKEEIQRLKAEQEE